MYEMYPQAWGVAEAQPAPAPRPRRRPRRQHPVLPPVLLRQAEAAQLRRAAG